MKEFGQTVTRKNVYDALKLYYSKNANSRISRAAFAVFLLLVIQGIVTDPHNILLWTIFAICLNRVFYTITFLPCYAKKAFEEIKKGGRQR